MRKNLLLTILGMAIAVVAWSCTSNKAAPPDTKSDLKPVASIQEIMEGMVEPSADFLWNSVSTTIDATGVHERYPKTDEEWTAVRGSAIALIEAPNLILMQPRNAAPPGSKSENPGIELEPAQIQKLIDDDRATFVKLAMDLQAEAIKALKAIDAKDKEMLIDVGGPIDHACEQCHLKYWYPNEAAAAKAQAEGKTSLQEKAATKEEKKEDKPEKK